VHTRLLDLALALLELGTRYVRHVELFAKFGLVDLDDFVLRQRLAGDIDVLERLELGQRGGGEEVREIMAVVGLGGDGDGLRT